MFVFYYIILFCVLVKLILSQRRYCVLQEYEEWMLNKGYSIVLIKTIDDSILYSNIECYKYNFYFIHTGFLCYYLETQNKKNLEVYEYNPKNINLMNYKSIKSLILNKSIVVEVTLIKSKILDHGRIV